MSFSESNIFGWWGCSRKVYVMEYLTAQRNRVSNVEIIDITPQFDYLLKTVWLLPSRSWLSAERFKSKFGTFVAIFYYWWGFVRSESQLSRWRFLMNFRQWKIIPNSVVLTVSKHLGFVWQIQFGAWSSLPPSVCQLENRRQNCRPFGSYDIFISFKYKF